MSYEQHCNDFALYGDPEREHWDHEFNAQYDRWDGHRGEGDADFCQHELEFELQEEANLHEEFSNAVFEDFADYLELED